MRSPYDILGVSQSADEDTLKKAYRKLAKDYHPDRNPGDQAVAERFKEVSGAYAFLSDADNRARYDRGEIDENGNPRFARAGGPGAGAGPRGGGFADFDMEDAEGLFSEFFRFNKGGRGGGARSTGRQSRVKSRGLDITYNVTVGFEEALNGSKREIRLNDGRRVNVSIPAGIQSGQVVRLAGQGGNGLGGAESGDALIEVQVAPHPFYKREGMDIHVELPISLDEAILGGDLEVPTPKGKVTVRIPANSSSGRRLRLKGKGVQKKDDVGNMYVLLKLVLPQKPDPKLEELIKEWGGEYGKQLRKDAGFS